MKQLKISLFALLALICPVVQADIKEQIIGAAVGAGIIGLNAYCLAKSKFSFKGEPLHGCIVETMPQELEKFLVDDLIKSGIDEIPVFRVSSGYSGPVYKCIYVHCTTVERMLESLKAGEDLAEKFAAELVKIRHACWSTINLPELQSPNQIRQWGMQVWGACLGAAIPTKSITTCAMASLVGMFAGAYTIIWGMHRAYNQEVRDADTFAIEHTRDPRQLEAMAIYLEEQEDAHGGGCYAERAQIYRKAAEKIKAAQAA